MTPYEFALLVFTAIMVCLLLWDSHKLRHRLERDESDIEWTKRAVKDTIAVHHKALERLERKIKQTDEALGNFSNQTQRFMNDQPDFVRMRADMDRLLKSEMYRRTASQAVAELRRERPL